ncbi:MAG TPA: M10 family metallopeptidase C-terminal domain-containing protein [Vitreimonas sp.]|uniref:M10 family metallopeptidase C-terminal domain-containing protein n=1 Tax=Vitreimonas sp. TaxID=3069702 RepID=UPI002D2BA857|nr:M10 family metallopeptidase C-terminal domain-containing protein [Vitreimonas sp.]HYD88587.1 M10 family metallopeptidase C-terminal domain-containing protein [Vitreimonas sp.]
MPRSTSLSAWSTGAEPPADFQTPTAGTAPNGLPYFSWDQGAAQLNREGWSWSATLATPITITYGFRATGPVPSFSGVSGFAQFNAIQIGVAEELLDLWSEVANISFVRSGAGYANTGAILFGNFINGPPQFSAFTYLPEPGATAGNLQNGDIWVNVSRDYDANPLALPLGAQILLHEIGHAIGILHPSEYDGGAAGGATYVNDADFWQDTRQFTVMSYFSETNTGASYGNYYVTAPQMYDIAAAQYLYGANMTTRTGDTVYGFGGNTGHAVFTIASASQGAIFCIWDAGGEDTLNLSGYATNSHIDLRAESFSSAGFHSTGAMIGNISIARGVTIENAVGGAGADTIIGNAAANLLTGNAGADVISGGAGFDTAIYAGASSGAIWTRNASGAWTVSAEGGDTLNSVERIRFSDRDIYLDPAQQTFSGNGTSDVLFRGADGALVSWEVAGAGLVSHAYLGAVGLEWAVANTADFDGDGRDDILWRRDDGLTFVWRMDGGAIAGAGFTSLQVGAEWQIAQTGDFNADGRDDILWRDGSGVTAIWMMGATGLDVAAATATAQQVGLDWSIAALGDLDGDGRDDIVWRNEGGATVVWRMDGASAVAAAATSAQPGLEWAIAGVGDFDGDGREDLLWRHENGLTAIWRMDGAEIMSAAATSAQVGNEWAIAGVGDYDGDGRSDILWRNDDLGGLVYVWIMNGSIVAQSRAVSSAGAEWDVVAGG